MWRKIWEFVFIMMGLLIAPVAARAESPSVIEVAKFSSGEVGQAIPDGWKPLSFKKIPKHTSYEVVRDEGVNKPLATGVPVRDLPVQYFCPNQQCHSSVMLL